MAYSTTGLPVIPYTLTTIIDGIKYETHVLTNTCQVITEDGVTLCDILKNLVSNTQLEEALKEVKIEGIPFKYKGVLNDLPDKTAIQQLYEKVGSQTGDIYLVQIGYANCTSGEHVPTLAYDMYCWIDKIATWVWIGSTQRNPDLNSLPLDTLKRIPATLGKPGEFIMVAEDGTTLVWASPDQSSDIKINTHNTDPKSHADIRQELSTKGDKLKIFNTTIRRDDWYWDGNGAYFTYLFRDNRIKAHSYFELTPIATKKTELEILQKANIQPIFNIEYNDEISYAILHSNHVPEADIQVCVKIFGDYDDI